MHPILDQATGGYLHWPRNPLSIGALHKKNKALTYHQEPPIREGSCVANWIGSNCIEYKKANIRSYSSPSAFSHVYA